MRFGTDGVRGVANRDVTPELALAVGRAAALRLGGPTLLIGRDTRRSGPMIEAAVAAGAASCGVDVVTLGVIPTPGVAYLSDELGAPAAMISASHNPFGDNGIKLFARGGSKLDDDLQNEVEATLLAISRGELDLDMPVDGAVGSVEPDPSLISRYRSHLAAVLDGRRLDGLEVVLDCAHGAASGLAADIFESSGAAVEAICVEPDGININEGCGSTHMGALADAVTSRGADVGFAYDGDADRVLAVDRRGRVIDGDQLMAICAIDMSGRGTLEQGTVVVTVMTNLGFRQGMERAGVKVVETNVGDRHVLAALDAGGLSLGGEQSGHLVFRDHATTGDGILASLLVSDLLVRSGTPIDLLADGAMTRLPQLLVNVGVDSPMPDVADRLAEVLDVERRALGDSGRILVRPSGTEPVVRVMVEAPDDAAAAAVASRLCEAVNTLR